MSDIQYGVQIKSNADMPSEHWVFDEDCELTDEVDEARFWRAAIIQPNEYGYMPDHVRVVKIEEVPDED